MKGIQQQTADFTEVLEAAVAEKTRSLEEVILTLQADNNQMTRLLEKERVSGRLKSSFVSLASHEFRTPLSSILLSAALIEQYFDRLDKQKIFGHLIRIKSAVNDLTGVLDDFLSVERIEMGKVQAVTKEFELGELCRSVVNEMQPLAKPGQVLVPKGLSTNTVVYLDPNLLRHCLVNLLSNAIKYSPEQTDIEVIIQKGRDKCSITVKDHGIGIPGAGQKHLFEPFFRADNVGDIPGTGLGLNIVKRYCELMKVELDFKSSEHGTTFTLSFRL